MALSVGSVAPDFQLDAVTGERRHKVRLEDLSGSYVVLSFYPLNWTPVCSTQTTSFNSLLPEFDKLDARIIGISTDSVYSHMAWQQHSVGALRYPLASDFYPHGAVARAYDVFRTGEPIPGIIERSVFIIDPDGKIAFSKTYELGEQPDHEEILQRLRELHRIKQKAV